MAAGQRRADVSCRLWIQPVISGINKATRERTENSKVPSVPLEKLQAVDRLVIESAITVNKSSEMPRFCFVGEDGVLGFYPVSLRNCWATP